MKDKQVLIIILLIVVLLLCSGKLTDIIGGFSSKTSVNTKVQHSVEQKDTESSDEKANVEKEDPRKQNRFYHDPNAPDPRKQNRFYRP